jgi:hypothetical protein
MAVNQIVKTCPIRPCLMDLGANLIPPPRQGRFRVAGPHAAGGFLKEMECSLKGSFARAETARRYLGCLLPESNVLITKRSNPKSDALCED